MAGRPKALMVLTGSAEDELSEGGTALPQLEPVANRPILAHMLDQIAEAGVEEVGLVAADEAWENVRSIVEDGSAWGLRARYVPHEERLGPGDAILAAEGFLEERPFMLHHGDCVVDGSLRPVLERAARHNLDGLLVVRGRNGHAVGGPAAGRGRLTDPSGLPLRMLMEAQVVPALMLSQRVLGLLHGLRPSWRGQIELADAIEGMRREGGDVELQTVRGWRFSGSVEDLLAGNRALLDRLVTRYAGRQPPDSRVDGRVMIHRSARVEGSVIRGPSIVGPRAHVIDSYVGPYSSVGAGALVEGSEIEDLIVGEGAVVTKLGRRLAASVVGPAARLSRDFGVSDALRVHLGARSEIVLS